MNGQELTAKLLQILQLTRTRPAWVFGYSQPSYEQVAHYFEGYLDAIGLTTGRMLYNNIRNWHMQQQRESFPCSWARYVKLTHKEASENELIGLLVDGIEIYFQQNTDWQEVDIPLRIWFDDEEE